jgi:hypothetical protein
MPKPSRSKGPRWTEGEKLILRAWIEERYASTATALLFHARTYKQAEANGMARFSEANAYYWHHVLKFLRGCYQQVGGELETLDRAPPE